MSLNPTCFRLTNWSFSLSSSITSLGFSKMVHVFQLPPGAGSAGSVREAMREGGMLMVYSARRRHQDCMLGPNIPWFHLMLGRILTWYKPVPLAESLGCSIETWRWAVQPRFPNLLRSSGSLGPTQSSLFLQVSCGMAGHQRRDPSWGRHILGSLCCHSQSQGSWFIPWQ